MAEFLRNHQMNIMLALGSICLIIAFFVSLTKTLTKRRKRVLQLLEVNAAILLFSDRFAYIYRGDTSVLGFYMVRISNYLVYATSLLVIQAVNLYITDLLVHDVGLTNVPKRLKAVSASIIIGEVLLIISQFTGMYYTFDETNHYQRASLFMVCYLIPLFILVLELSVVINYFRRINRGIGIALILFTLLPGAASIMQIFLYGLSLTNISIVGMAIVLYVFALIDMNETVERAHEIEIQNMQGEKVKLQRLFDQTATAFVSAIEKKDEYIKGKSVKTAEYARRIAELSGKTPDECEKVYYAALLHDVGLMGIPDSVIKNDATPGESDYEIIKQKPVIGNEILSSITEYPYLSVGAHFSHERYNGAGYPDGLKGEDIPEIARIIAVADAYVTMTTKKRYREAKPDFMAREAFFRGAGEEFDPKFAEIMIRIIDADSSDKTAKDTEKIEKSITCDKYRDHISIGLPIEYEIMRITFEYSPLQNDADHEFSAPSVILFDSYDGRVHDNERAIEAYQYLEYGEVWFDEHSVQAEARKLEEKTIHREDDPSSKADTPVYEILMGRYEDHLKLRMLSPSFEKEVIVALPSGSKSAYLAITGENCNIKNISAEKTGETVGPEDIPRIVSATSYIDRMESDVRNIQADRPRSASTAGVELKDRLRLMFHTMSLPGSKLVWHCPYFVLFYSDDGTVGGKNYREYGLVKLYGENEGDTEFAHNSITMKKTEEFPGWDVWKEANKKGLECEVTFRKKDNRIILKTRNLGIETENVTTITEAFEKVYVALTGDQVAITDIRVR